MKRLAFALLLLAPAAQAAGLTPAQIKKIDGLVQTFMTKGQVPGLSIAVVKDGAIAWSKGYGYADVENQVPARPNTMYRSASIGKTNTATAAMRLVELGKLDLDADIRGTCPAFPAKPWKITARNLIQHTSGIRHYGGPNNDAEQHSTIHYPTVSAALAPFKDDSLRFEPGTQWGYTTYGFNVLGCVIEGAAGKPFLEAMRSLVWDPAGMKSTRDDDPAALVPHRAAGYSLADGKLRRAPFADMSNRMAGGAYLTNVEDLAAFAAAMIGNRIVKAETFQQMLTPTRIPGQEPQSYGMGWGVEIEPWHEDTYAYHGGSSPGVSGFLVLMPKHRASVVYLTNLEDASGRGELGEDVMRLVLGFKPREP